MLLNDVTLSGLNADLNPATPQSLTPVAVAKIYIEKKKKKESWDFHFLNPLSNLFPANLYLPSPVPPACGACGEVRGRYLHVQVRTQQDKEAWHHRIPHSINHGQIATGWSGLFAASYSVLQIPHKKPWAEGGGGGSNQSSGTHKKSHCFQICPTFYPTTRGQHSLQ